MCLTIKLLMEPTDSASSQSIQGRDLGMRRITIGLDNGQV